jgi:hypothetical protein
MTNTKAKGNSNRLSDLDLVDCNLQVFLAVSNAFFAVFTSAVVCGIELLTLDHGFLGRRLERGDDLRAFKVGGADFDVFAVADKQNLAQLDSLGIGRNIGQFDIERIAFGDFVLLRALFNDWKTPGFFTFKNLFRGGILAYPALFVKQIIRYFCILLPKMRLDSGLTAP